jgi:hypothetical protein
MTDAPVCARSGCDQRVKLELSKKGGARWRTYCSRRCVGLARKAEGYFDQMRKKRATQFYVKAIRRAVGEGWQDGHPVTLQQLIAVARTGYRQGWQSRNMRDERP